MLQIVKIQSYPKALFPKSKMRRLQREILTLLIGLSSLSTLNAAVTINAVGDGSGYDETNVPSFRSSNVTKDFDVDGDHIYGTEGLFFFGEGSAADGSGNPFSQHTDLGPTWITGFAAGVDFNSVAEGFDYDPIDDPTLSGADVADWSIGSAIAVATGGAAGDWLEIMTFTIDASAPTNFRIGVMAGNEANSDGRWDPTGLRLTFSGGSSAEVTTLENNANGEPNWVFFDIAISAGTAGTFSIEGQKRFEDQGPSMAGVTFDVSPTAGVLAGYDFDDGDGNATTAVTVKQANIIASDYTTGTGLNDFISNNANGLAEATDVDGNVLGTANPISFGGAQSDFGFTEMGNEDDLDLAITNNDYMTFTVSPNGGYGLDLDSLTFRTRANQANNSADRWALFSSVDGFASGDQIATGQTTDLATWTGASNNILIDLTGASYQGLESVTFRLYIYGGNTNSSSATLFDKVVLNGTLGDDLNAPVIDMFVAAHTDADGLGKLAWSVSNATSVSILDSSDQPVAGVSELEGIVDVSYISGESYTLVAENNGSERTETRSIAPVSTLSDKVTFSFDDANVVDAPGDDTGIGRRDPSDVIKVGDTWHVWYSRMVDGITTGYDASVWHATSTNEGYDWVEQGEAVPRGAEATDEWDMTSTFTPNILFHDGIYYLYYTAVGPDFNQDYNEAGKTGIGVSTSTSPYGPWTKSASNPILVPSADTTKFDSFRVDDTCMAIRGGKVWMYYKGRPWGLSASHTKMGVAVATSGGGPFVKQNGGDPVQLGGHEVQIWMDAHEGIFSMVNGVGPASLTYTLQYAADGLNFTKYADISSSEPSAPGMYRPELTNPSAGGSPEWGVYGTRQLGRYAIDLPVSEVTFSLTSVSGVGPETGVYRRDPSDIIKVGDTWHVWYSMPEGAANGPATIGHATSTNAGVDWVEQATAIPRGSEVDNVWDSGSAFTPNILLHEGTYYLYYTGVSHSYWTPGDTYSEDQKFRIGVASSDSPYGPWTKYAGNPILIPSADTSKFDSFRVDDSCLAVRDGEIWLYHKGRQWENTPQNTKMGVVIADDPLGPFVRQNDGDPVQLGGHEVQIWMDESQGVYSMISSVGPADLTHTIQYAADGMNFSKYADVSTSDPSAPGMYRTELTDLSSGGMPEWGMYGVSSLARFEVHYNDTVSTRVRLNPSSIVEGNRLGDFIGTLSVTDSADYAFELLALADADDFAFDDASVTANTVFDASLATEHGFFVRASSGDSAVDGYFDVSVLDASGMRYWRLEQFGADTLAQPELESTVWGDAANPDGDGFNNGGEYSADTLPLDADSALQIESFASNESSVQLSWSGGVQATQYLESSDTLDADDWDIEETFLPPTPSSNVWSDSVESDADKLFFRIRVER